MNAINRIFRSCIAKDIDYLMYDYVLSAMEQGNTFASMYILSAHLEEGNVAPVYSTLDILKGTEWARQFEQAVLRKNGFTYEGMMYVLQNNIC